MVRKNTSTIDGSEIEQFSRMADFWWDSQGAFAPLHRMTHVRMEFIRNMLKDHLSSDATSNKPFAKLQILDIGCGGGLLSEPLTRLGANVTGLDASIESVNAAKLHAHQSSMDINYVVGGVEDLSGSKEKFDVVLASEVIEHVANPEKFILEASKLLTPGGAFLLTTINRSFQSLLAVKIMGEYVIGLLPRGTHDWNKFLTPEEVVSLFNRSGITPVVFQGISYDVLRDQFSLTKNLSINFGAYGRL